MREKKQGKRDFRVTQLFVIKTVAQYAPSKIALEFLLEALKNVMTTLNAVWLLHYIVDSMENNSGFSVIVRVLVIFLFANMICAAAMQWYRNYYKPKIELTLYDRLSERLIEKAEQLSIKYYEQPEFYTIVSRTQKAMESTLLLAFANLAQVFGYVIAVFSAVLVVTGIDPALSVFAIFAVPMLFIGEKYGKLFSDKQKDLAYSERVKNYMQETWLAKEYARVFKVSMAARIPDQYYEKACQESVDIHRRYQGGLMRWDFMNSGMSVNFVAIVCYAYAFIRLVFMRNYSIAEFSIMFVAIMNMISRISRISKCYEKANRYQSDMDAVRQFMDLQAEDVSGPQALKPAAFETLEFKHVSFSYDGVHKVLKDVSFQIRAGEKVALAGYNGAGKSTLVKLLLRFYEPQEGVILYNGIDIGKYRLKAWRKIFSTVFQDFYIFNLPLADNVLLQKKPDSGYQNGMDECLMRLRAGELCGSKDKILGRQYDDNGIILSGGQKQKLAVARMFFSRFQIAVMDEPSSAMDPVSEEEVMESVDRNLGGRTLILISHNMGMVRKADKVLFFENGTLTGNAPHETLVRSNSIYKEFYDSQAEKYSSRESGKL